MAMRDLIPWRKRRGRPESVDLAESGDFNDMFRDAMEDFFGVAPGLAPWLRKGIGLGPAVDISETDTEYRVEAELPGLKKDNLDVSIDNGRLYIRGERQEENKDERENYVRVERSYGSFSRTLPLPPTVKEDEAEAEYKDGILTVRLPKTGEARGKKVEIKDSE